MTGQAQKVMKKRAKQSVCCETEYAKTLTQIFLIMKESGYCGEDMIEDLRDLVNESQPATEADELEYEKSCRPRPETQREFGGLG